MLRKKLMTQINEIFSDVTKSHVIKYNEFDFHLLFVVIPIVCVFATFALRKYLFNTSGLKRKLINKFLFSLLVVSLLGTLVIRILEHKMFASSFNVLNNFFELDFLISTVIVFSLFLKIDWLFRAFVPLSIVFGISFIIGTPGQTQSNYEIMFDVFFSIIPLILLMMNHTKYSFKEAILGIIFTISMVCLIAFRNTQEHLVLSNITNDMLDRIIFYNIFSGFEMQVFAYILIAIMTQILITLIIGWNIIAVTQKISFKKYIKTLHFYFVYECFHLMLLVSKTLDMYGTFEEQKCFFAKLEKFVSEKYNELQIHINETQEVMNEQNKKELPQNNEYWDIDNYSNSFSIGRIILTNTGPRSPSL